MTPEPTESPQATEPVPVWRRLLPWWPMLLPPLVIPAVYAARAAGWEVLVGKGLHERLALVIVAAAVVVFAVRWWKRRDPLHLVFAVVSIVFLCREIHFKGTHQGVYVGLGLIAVWCVVWRRRLIEELQGRPRKQRWLAMVVWSYALALLVQRRAFKFLPDEADLHIQMEETLENLSHAFLVVFGLA